jgi:hypothetical protein
LVNPKQSTGRPAGSLVDSDKPLAGRSICEHVLDKNCNRLFILRSRSSSLAPKNLNIRTKMMSCPPVAQVLRGKRRRSK